MSFITKRVKGVQGYLTLPPTEPPTTAPPTEAPTTAAPPDYSSGVSAIEQLTSGPVTITGAAGAHTKGAWVELIASTSKEYNGLLVSVSLPSAGNVNMLIDIGAGANPNEAVIIQDIPLRSNTTADESGFTFYLPLRVAQGTRLVARCQSTDGGGDTCRVVIQGFVKSAALYASVVTYGSVPATTRLTQIDPGASAGTKGAWVPLVASTSNKLAYVGLMLLLSNLSVTTGSWSIDIGVGAEGEEVVVAADLYLGTHANFDHAYPMFIGMFPLDIPAGSRIAIRASSSITDATDRIFDVALLGAEW